MADSKVAAAANASAPAAASAAAPAPAPARRTELDPAVLPYRPASGARVALEVALHGVVCVCALYGVLSQVSQYALHNRSENACGQAPVNLHLDSTSQLKALIACAVLFSVWLTAAQLLRSVEMGARTVVCNALWRRGVVVTHSGAHVTDTSFWASASGLLWVIGVAVVIFTAYWAPNLTPALLSQWLQLGCLAYRTQRGLYRALSPPLSAFLRAAKPDAFAAVAAAGAGDPHLLQAVQRLTAYSAAADVQISAVCVPASYARLDPNAPALVDASISPPPQSSDGSESCGVRLTRAVAGPKLLDLWATGYVLSNPTAWAAVDGQRSADEAVRCCGCGCGGCCDGSGCRCTHRCTFRGWLIGALVGIAVLLAGVGVLIGFEYSDVLDTPAAQTLFRG